MRHRIVAATSLLGGASVISTLLGLLKMKAVAVVLGPAGVGVIGILQNAMGLAAIIGDMGMRQSGAREIARSQTANSTDEYSIVRKSLKWMSWILALLSAGLFWSLAKPIAIHFLENASFENDLRWLSLAIAATVLAAGHTAVLNGHQKVKDIAKIAIFGALASSVISIGALMAFGSNAIIPIILSAPVANYFFCLIYVRKIDSPPLKLTNINILISKITNIVKLGIFVMLGAVFLSISELAIRYLILRDYGIWEIGLFTAAWTLSVYYTNFLMVSISSDFYPRISGIVENRSAAVDAINLQVETILLMSAPLFFVTCAAAPLIFTILYSEKFEGAADLMRLIAIGDVLKLSVYPMGFALLATSAGSVYFITKAFEAIGLVVLTALLLPKFGLVGIGLSYCVLYLISFGFHLIFLKSRLGFVPSKTLVLQLCVILAVSVAIERLAAISGYTAIGLAAIAVFVWIVIAYRKLILHSRTTSI